MKKAFIGLCGLILVVGALGSIKAHAGNITIWDTVVSGSPGTWYNRGTTPGEDQEVEPGCSTGQKWDLEAFVTQWPQLSMIGGFDFKNGVVYDHRLFSSGDIFLDVNGDAAYGMAVHGTGGGNVQQPNSLFHYEYALVLNFTDNTFDVYKLNSSSLLTVWYGQNDESNPWRLVLDTAELFAPDLTMIYEPGLTNAQVGFLGDTLSNPASHNRVTVDLSWLPAGEGLNFVHFTYECGNDNLMGRVPLPGAVWLLGSGLAGLGLLGRRRRRQS